MDEHSNNESVSEWAAQLRDGNSVAQNRIFERYADQIRNVARKYLKGVEQKSSDEEDVVIEVFNNLFAGSTSGQIPAIENRNHLWGLLLGIARNKSLENIRGKNAQKRGSGKVATESAFHAGDNEIPMGINQVAGNQQDPASRFELIDELDRLLDSVSDELSRQVLLLRLANFKRSEVADKLGCSERTVERKFRKLREAVGREEE